MEKALFNIRETIPIRRQCVQFIAKYLDDSIIPKYMEMYIDKNAINQIRNMMRSIKDQFTEKLKSNNWLSDTTRNVAIEKIARIKFLIAHPEFRKSKISKEVFQVTLRLCLYKNQEFSIVFLGKEYQSF